MYFSEVTGIITKLRENISIIKKNSKLGTEENCSFLIEKILYKKSITNTILNEETVSDFLLRAESLGCPLSPLLFSIVFNTSLGFSIYSTMLSANGDNFTSFFPV